MAQSQAGDELEANDNSKAVLGPTGGRKWGEVPRMDELSESADFEDASAKIRPGTNELVNSVVKKSVVLEHYKQGITYVKALESTVKTVKNAKESGDLERFTKNGEAMRETFKNGTSKEQAMMVAEAVAVQFASYRNPEGQLRDSYENTVENGDISELVALVRKSPKGGQFGNKFAQFVESRQYVELARVLDESGAEAAQDWAIDNISGIAPAKSGFWLLLLGFEVFVIDTNIRTLLIPYVQKVGQLGNLPDCQICRNASYSDVNNTPRLDGPSSKNCGGKWYMRGIWTKNRSYVEHHLRTHMDVHDIREYGRLILNRINEETNSDMNIRELTQVMFNAGMSHTKSDYDGDRKETFYGHEYFY